MKIPEQPVEPRSPSPSGCARWFVIAAVVSPMICFVASFFGFAALETARLSISCLRATANDPTVSCRLKEGLLFGVLGRTHAMTDVTSAKLELAPYDPDSPGDVWSIRVTSRLGDAFATSRSNMNVHERRAIVEALNAFLQSPNETKLEVSESLFNSMSLVGLAGLLVFGFAIVRLARFIGRARRNPEVLEQLIRSAGRGR